MASLAKERNLFSSISSNKKLRQSKFHYRKGMFNTFRSNRKETNLMGKPQQYIAIKTY